MKKKGKVLALMLASVMSGALVMGSGVVLTGCNNEKPPVTKEDQLTAPSSVSYANGKISWSAVTNATSYEVTVTKDGETTAALKQTVTGGGTELDVSSLASGSYTASVVALADGYTASAAKTAKFTVGAQLEALPTPTGFAYANGKITWTAVAGATAGYLVKVTKKSDNSVAIAEKTVTAAEIDVSALAAGEYSLSVTAKAVEGKNLASLAAAFAFTVEATQEKLATPAGGAVDAVNRKVTWTAVENAEEYEVTVSVGSSVELEDTVTTAELDISDLEDEDFTLTVVAKAEGYEASDVYTYNGSVTAVVLSKVTDLQADGGKTVLSFKHEAGGADHYRVVVKSGTETKLDKNVTTADDKGVYSLDIRALAAGNYTAEVYAVADEYDIFRSDSQAETLPFEVASLGAYEAVTGLRVDGANIVWDENNALGYEVIVTEKGKTQSLDINGVNAEGESFNFLATRLPAGDYTVKVTPKDNRHTGDGVAASYDIALQNVKTFNAEAIAKFDGETTHGGEHGKAELVTKTDGSKAAKVMPTVDGWGRVRSEAFMLNFNNNPVVYIDVDEVVVGGYHLEANIGGQRYSIIRDTLVAGNTIAKFQATIVDSKPPQPVDISGAKETYIRLGVNGSTTDAANDAETHFNSVSIWYLTEWKEAASGQLDAATDFRINNGTEVAWGSVENANSYNVTIVKNVENGDDEVVLAKTVQSLNSYSVRAFGEGDYTVTVSAINSENSALTESEEATFRFNVHYIQKYTAADIAEFTAILGSADIALTYDEMNGYTKINGDHAKNYGAVAPDPGAEVNLANRPFARVEIAGVEAKTGSTDYGYLIRAKFGGKDYVLANDTRVAADYRGDLFVDLWRNVDGNAITGTGAYRFGMGFVWDTSVFVKSLTYVEITAIEELDPDAHTPLAAPSNIREEKGVLKADIVDGNKAYTPKYAVKVTEKGGAEVYNGTNLSEPSVNLAALELTGDKTYVVSFKALGDNGYFVDSPETSVEVDYKAVTLLDSFADVDFTTYAERNGGSEEDGVRYPISLTPNADGSLSLTTKNGYWDFNFMALDLSEIIESIDTEYYMQLLVDGEKSTAGATIATRFTSRAADGTIVPATEKDNIRDTGYGEAPAGDTHLTKEWRDVISNDKTFGFAIGHGGNRIEGEVTEKTIVYTGIRFVKFTVKTNAD